VTPNSTAVGIRRTALPLPAQRPVPRGRRPIGQVPEVGFIAYKACLTLVKLSWRTRRSPSQWRGRRRGLCWPLSPCQQETGKPASWQSGTASGPPSHLFDREHVKAPFRDSAASSAFTARPTARTRPLSAPPGRCRHTRRSVTGHQAPQSVKVPLPDSAAAFPFTVHGIAFA
jgi:hypothetical protein